MLKRQEILNQKGMAVIEMIPIIIIVVLLLNFSIGFFGVVHTGILNNVAARNYTFETFRNRSDLTYHIRPQGSTKFKYRQMANRYSGMASEKASDPSVWIASARPIAFLSSFGGTDNDGVDMSVVNSAGNEINTHKRTIASAPFTRGSRQNTSSIGVTSVWIKTVYGICLDSKCGD